MKTQVEQTTVLSSSFMLQNGLLELAVGAAGCHSISWRDCFGQESCDIVSDLSRPYISELYGGKVSTSFIALQLSDETGSLSKRSRTGTSRFPGGDPMSINA